MTVIVTQGYRRQRGVNEDEHTDAHEKGGADASGSPFPVLLAALPAITRTAHSPPQRRAASCSAVRPSA
ncbi:MAG: hypothetical protein ACYCVB_18040 [Bacilli bacterium]